MTLSQGMIRPLYVVALVALALLVACSGDAADDTSPTPTASPTPSVSPPPTPTPSVTVPVGLPELLAGVTVEVLRVGQDLPFPAHHAIVTILGCMNCDGPAYGIGRIYRDGESRMVIEPLMWTTALNAVDGPRNSLGLPAENSYAVIGAAADATGSEIIAGVWGTGNKTTLFRSTDGGVSWANYLEMPGSHSPLLIVEPGQVLTGSYAFGEAVPYQIVPRGEVIERPDGGGSPALVDSEIVWNSNATRHDGPGVVSIYQDRHPGSVFYIAEREGIGPITRAFFSPDARVGRGWPLNDSQYLALAPFLQDSDRVAGRPYSGEFFGPLIPTIVDMETGEVHSIAEAWEGSQALSARGILSLQTGPFARVTGTSSCLNVRAEPSISAEVLTCAADNVLLTVVEPDQPGPDWLHVITPDGVEGFVSRDYIEVIG